MRLYPKVGLSLYRESGLKYLQRKFVYTAKPRLSLYRESGLKCLCMILYGFFIMSLPV